MRSKVLKAVVIGVVVALLGVSPVQGQSGPELGSPVTGAVETEPTQSEGSLEEGESLSDCHELYAQGEWTESEFAELLECLFDLSSVQRSESSPPDEAVDIQGTASDCGDVSVEYVVQQHLPERLYGIIIGHLRIYLMYVTCEDGSPAVGYSTGLQVTQGPGAPRNSDYCWVPNPRGRGVIERRTREANGCPSFISGLPDVGVSAHLHRISSRNDNRIRQVIMWADLNRNSRHDTGEPYDLAFSPDDIGSDSFSLRSIWGPEVSFPGQLATLGFQLVDQSGEPLSNTSVGVDILSGPNSESAISCFKPLVRIPSFQWSPCVTDDEGGIVFTYKVNSNNINSSRQSLDVLRVHIDNRVRDGRFSRGEPFRYSSVLVSKSVNYVALGDSYSSGENGRDSDASFKGTYLSSNPADPECRRWSLAYPLVFADTRTNVTVTTYACTGAITRNIYDPKSDNYNTNRPSKVATIDQDNPKWEPRQAVSLGQVGNVDMITVTIGGNDAGFADILKECLLTECDEDDLKAEDRESFADIGNRIEVVLRQLKAAAPDAAIFVLGYPYVTPKNVPQNCSSLTLIPALTALGGAGMEIMNYIRSASPARLASEAIVEPILELGTSAVSWIFGNPEVGDFVAIPKNWNLMRITNDESTFLRETTDDFNSSIRLAARKAGVHYVPVSDHFDGPSPCRDYSLTYGLKGQSAVQSPHEAIASLFGAVVNLSLSELEPILDSVYSARSFHPNKNGHEYYADLLDEYIGDLISSSPRGSSFNRAGLPVNPQPIASYTGSDESLV